MSIFILGAHMKKPLLYGLWVSFAALLVFSLACSDAATKRFSDTRGKEKVASKITISSAEQESKDDAQEPVTATPTASDEGSCSADLDCVPIPDNDGCIPCLEGASQRAVNKVTARSIMLPRKDVCMPKMKQLRESGQKSPPVRTNDESCKFNGAKCISGTCQLANLSEAEIKAHMPKEVAGGEQQQQPGPVRNPSFGHDTRNFNSPDSQSIEPTSGEGFNRAWDKNQGYAPRGTQGFRFGGT